MVLTEFNDLCETAKTEFHAHVAELHLSGPEMAELSREVLESLDGAEWKMAWIETTDGNVGARLEEIVNPATKSYTRLVVTDRTDGYLTKFTRLS